MGDKHNFKKSLGLCHGSGQGFEQHWFRIALPGVLAVGADIDENGAQYRHTVAPWDFHFDNPAWVGHADFVYSNSLAYSYDPQHAVQTWMRQVAADGMLIIEHISSTEMISTYPYVGTMAQLQRLVI